MGKKEELEKQWEYAWKRQRWDTQDEIEDDIAKITGETSVEVNRRLTKKKKFKKAR